MLKALLKTGNFYHIFNKSIANYKIFRGKANFYRFIQILDYYNDINPKIGLSQYLKSQRNTPEVDLLQPKENSVLKLTTFCLMPDHYHLQLKVLNDRFIYKFLNLIGMAYTRYFNTKFRRKGPLWQSSYKAVRVISSEQMLHLSRYIHLNPTSGGLVENPEDWEFSSYRNYINNPKILNEIITEVSIKDPRIYKKFVENNKDYQKKLKLIKKALIE